MANISKELYDEIKSHNDIVDVISSYIDVNDKNKALCPFHNDHHESLSISKDKQIFKCFSCGASGDVFKFISRYENCTYYEAIQKLADKSGIKVKVGTIRKVNADFKKIYDINSTVNSYFKNNLLSQEGKTALKYLNDRGLDRKLINEFDIGLAIGGNKLSSLLSKKYSIEDLIESDIIKKINDNNYDSFQNRIIFPIIDENNNVVAFSGRKYLDKDLSNDELPKYYNTKETKVFIKSNTMYNLNNSKNNIIKNKEIIITEGFMDTIRLWSIGYTNVVALMGTAFTKNHLETILKLKCKVVLNLDQDSPGKSTTSTIGEELIKNNIDVSVIVFDDYKDSDELIVKKGKEAFDISYNNRIPFIDFKLKYLKENKNMKDSTDISKFINEAIEFINKTEDDILKELKIKELSTEFNIDESVIKNKLKTTNIKKEEIKEEQKEQRNKRYNKYDISEIRILYFMLNYDDAINVFENHVGSLIKDNMSHLAYKIIEFRNDYGYFDYGDFIFYINENEQLNETLEEVMKYQNKEEFDEKELNDCVRTIKEYSINKRIETLMRQMTETLDVNKKIDLGEKIKNIRKEVSEW